MFAADYAALLLRYARVVAAEDAPAVPKAADQSDTPARLARKQLRAAEAVSSTLVLVADVAEPSFISRLATTVADLAYSSLVGLNEGRLGTDLSLLSDCNHHAANMRGHVAEARVVLARRPEFGLAMAEAALGHLADVCELAAKSAQAPAGNRNAPGSLLSSTIG